MTSVLKRNAGEDFCGAATQKMGEQGNLHGISFFGSRRQSPEV